MSARTIAAACGLLSMTALVACRDDPAPPSASASSDGGEGSSDTGDSTVEPEPPPPLPPTRPETQTCRFDGWAPGLLPPLGFEPADAPPIEGALALAVSPEGIVLVGDDEGTIWAFDPDDSAEPLVELRPGDGDPITGLAVGPSNGLDALFVRARRTTPSRTIVTRYTRDGPRSIDLSSNLTAVQIDHEGTTRSGAGLIAAEGLLWVPLGDDEQGQLGGPADDPQQREGNLLRLDVSELSLPQGAEPATDNPRFDEGGPAAEAWAWGLRDPAGCMVDVARERVWCVDRGANVSEVSEVPPAANLGWPRIEGSDCQLPGGCDTIDTQLPQATYRHVPEDCGVGPTAIADGMDEQLDGAVVYADRCSGRMFAARPPEIDRPSARALVGQLNPTLVSLAADPNGGLWGVDVEGQLGRLEVRRPPGQFPLTLADSGCFDGPGVTTPAPDLIPYALNAPLWTDDSHKERFLVLPPGEQLHIEEDGRLQFPEGALIVKNFSYPKSTLEPDTWIPAETRVMIRRSYTWEFHSYRWNDDGTESTLLDDGESRVLLTAVDGAPTIVNHTYPSRDECGYCHGNGDVRLLGPRIDQLARQVDYGDQLQALADLELFDGPLPSIEPMADYRDPAVNAQDRARAYLHANCGHCHRPGGWTPPDLDMDLRWSTPTEQTNLCDVPPQYSSTFPADYRIQPQNPGNSLVWLRLSSRGPWQMPPFATSIPDPSALVVRDWIAGLDQCPETE